MTNYLLPESIRDDLVKYMHSKLDQNLLQIINILSGLAAHVPGPVGAVAEAVNEGLQVVENLPNAQTQS